MRHTQLDALRFECTFPDEHVMIDAVDQRAVEIEQETRIVARHSLFANLRNRGTAIMGEARGLHLHRSVL